MKTLPRVCWTIAAERAGEVMAQVRSTPGVRFVELRADYLLDPDEAPGIIRKLRRMRIEVLVTLRSLAAGGRYAGGLGEQLGLLTAYGGAGAAAVDLEIESAERAGAAPVAALRDQAALVVSFHDFEGTPSPLHIDLARLRRIPADCYKVVTTSHTHADNAAVLELYEPKRGARTTKGRPPKLVAFAMGEVGMPTRVLSIARGAPWSYAALSAGQAVAPGQIPGEEMVSRYRVEQITAKTAFYGVIGNPVAHSISPAVHNAAFAATRRNAVYLPFRVDRLDDFLAALPAYRLAGFSITIPHKEAMAGTAGARLDAVARTAGAVNTVVVRGAKLQCYNTDMAGVTVPLGKRMKLAAARILVAGTGGAARAAAFALAGERARVAIVGRRTELAAALAEAVNGEVVERNSLSGEPFDAIVHATPLGMEPDTESCFFGAGELNAPVLLETVYTPAETKLVRLARERGIEVILGMEMFLEQAVRQFELWTRRKAPRAIMERAVKEALRSGVRPVESVPAGSRKASAR